MKIIRNIKSFFRDKLNKVIDNNKEIQNKHPLTHVYTDKNGRKWYRYKDVLSMPVKRMIAIETATRFADMKITESDLKSAIVRAIDHLGKGEVIELTAILIDLRYRLEEILEETSLLQLAAVFFIEKYEDKFGYNANTNEQKIEYWRKDEEMLAFFLTNVAALLKNLQTTSAQDILSYLSKAQGLRTHLRRSRISWQKSIAATMR